jgi:hypothetical protein
MTASSLQSALDAIGAIRGLADPASRKELELLAKDLEEAMLTIFVKTPDAKPLLERIAAATEVLESAVNAEGQWGEKSVAAFGPFQRAVSKLRSAIMVRTQRAT